MKEASNSPGLQPAQVGMAPPAVDSVRLSAQSSHPAYMANTTNPEEANREQSGKGNASCAAQHVTVLVVCSENGSVTLITLDVSLMF